MSNKLIELAHLRNVLFSADFNEASWNMLQKVKKDILALKTPFEDIAINAINNSEEDIKNLNFTAAAQELSLIHNFPFKNYREWNSDYFYSVELSSYLDNTEDVPRIKKLIFLLSKLVDKFDI